VGLPSSDEKICPSGLSQVAAAEQGASPGLALFSWVGLPEAHLPVEVELSADPKGSAGQSDRDRLITWGILASCS